ncbi:MAG: hypothetical protein Q4Q04_03235, partial [Methanocorpusculum sp.]|nr:hypothetical protein [Methanocorpusculum sp.]
VNVKRKLGLGFNEKLEQNPQNKWSFFAFKEFPYETATLTVYYQVNNHQNSFTINVIINSDDIIEDIYVHA